MRVNGRRVFGGIALAAALAGRTAVAQDGGRPPAKPETASEAKEQKPMPKPKVGEPAPDFKVKDHTGTDVTLAQFKGKKNVLLAFYPKSFTGG